LAKHWQSEALKEGITPSLLIYYKEKGIDPAEEEENAPHPLHDEARSKMDFDENWNPLPVPYKKGLLTIMPRVKPHNREKRFLLFLETEGLHSKLNQYMNSGFPGDVFENFYVRYKLWWAQRNSGLKSKAGKSKKKKQGQVLKRNDRRKGARAGNFFEKIKKIP